MGDSKIVDMLRQGQLDLLLGRLHEFVPSNPDLVTELAARIDEHVASPTGPTGPIHYDVRQALAHCPEPLLGAVGRWAVRHGCATALEGSGRPHSYANLSPLIPDHNQLVELWAVEATTPPCTLACLAAVLAADNPPLDRALLLNLQNVLDDDARLSQLPSTLPLLVDTRRLPALTEVLVRIEVLRCRKSFPGHHSLSTIRNALVDMRRVWRKRPLDSGEDPPLPPLEPLMEIVNGDTIGEISRDASADQLRAAIQMHTNSIEPMTLRRLVNVVDHPHFAPGPGPTGSLASLCTAVQNGSAGLAHTVAQVEDLIDSGRPEALTLAARSMAVVVNPRLVAKLLARDSSTFPPAARPWLGIVADSLECSPVVEELGSWMH